VGLAVESLFEAKKELFSIPNWLSTAAYAESNVESMSTAKRSLSRTQMKATRAHNLLNIVVVSIERRD
jgi:hypothetical protein